MSRTRYDFKEAASFFNYCVPLNDLRVDVSIAMQQLSGKRLSKEKKDEIWHTLLTCADLLDTISQK